MAWWRIWRTAGKRSVVWACSTFLGMPQELGILKGKRPLEHRTVFSGLPWWLIGKGESPLPFPGGTAANAGNAGSIPGEGRSPGEGNGNPHQYSCLGNPMDRKAWWVTVQGVTESRTRRSNQATAVFSLYTTLISVCIVLNYSYMFKCELFNALFFKKFFFDLLIFFVAVWAFSSCSEQGLLSSCGAWASHCGGFTCCGARALGYSGFGSCSSVVVASQFYSTGSIVVAQRLGCSAACGILLNEGSNPHLLRWHSDSLPVSHHSFPPQGSPMWSMS